jgi:predicted regulator of Ras-like GTPase activity (Roadblock/LC7/MglB family)
MDAAQALADLTEISSQLVHVAILDQDGSVLATTLNGAEASARFASGVRSLLEEADAQARTLDLSPTISQLDVSTFAGSVFAVRADGRTIAATTRPDPTVGLVLYDLKRCLESLTEPGTPDVPTGNGAALSAKAAAAEPPGGAQTKRGPEADRSA